MSLLAFTPTNKRPVCFALLEQWVKSQTLQPDLWLVVTDSCSGYTFNMNQKVIKRKDHGHGLSFIENWKKALPEMEGFDKIAVIEDDDYYAPTYLETMSKLLDEHELAGIANDVYYNLPTRRFKNMYNDNHASLACTGFRSTLLPFVKSIVERKDIYIDLLLWEEHKGNKRLINNMPRGAKPYHVGMKNMPGLAGLGLGHTQRGVDDPLLAKLREWTTPEAFYEYKTLSASLKLPSITIEKCSAS